MKIRAASLSDLDAILSIYESARRFMKESGNPHQWGSSYPQKELVISDIAAGKLFTLEDSDGLLAAFYFAKGPDPTYLKIYDGEWQGSENYSVIHRIAVSERARGRGVAKLCFDFCLERAGEIRIDTHRDNRAMQASLLKNGFSYCGVIRLDRADSDSDDCERLAYHKKI
ncbi:MAG: GNAT family N-acetyltransferase [Clostridia bacterium]|nr:GNAT family N-acetyltransferase [Clostridia bacterium]